MCVRSLSSATPIETWSLVNAVGVLGAAAVAVWTGSPWPVVAGGGALLCGLVLVAAGAWTPQGRFGAANTVTAVRGVLLGLLPPAAGAWPEAFVGLGGLILATDGLDGWLARRQTLSSEFGAFFDKETDALFLLILCLLAVFEGRVSFWIMGVGLLRYGFVLALFLLPPAETTEDRSTLARYVYTGMVLALLTAFLPMPAVSQPLVGLAAGALVFSFARSFWRIVPRGRAFGEP